MDELDEDYEKILQGEKKEVAQCEAQILETVLDYFNIIKVQWNLAGEAYSADPEFIKEYKLKRESTDKELEKAEIDATQVPPALTR